VNAYNMLDHADGIAAAAGTAAFVALALGQLTFGDYALACAALTAAGALAGFLIYNFPPAKLFMGDAGTMLVGFLLAALTIQAQYYHEGQTLSRWVVLIPLAILAVPLFDMVCVTLSRIRRRQSPFRGDAASHLAHRMLARGWSPRGIVAFAAGVSAVSGGASVAMYFLSGPALMLPWLAVAAVLVAMLLVRRPVCLEATS
jgi:UDP-GlcNAc:undecaprenyl-phosphate GlcNAc-1-phosphate transferase